MVQWFCLVSWRLFDVWTSYFGIVTQYDMTFNLKYKYRSLWPIFHGPVILPYILKTIWYMNTILWNYESVWPGVWPKNKCRSLWPKFHGPVILAYILKTIDVWTSDFWFMSQYGTLFDLKIILDHCDLHFMVQWFCLISFKTIWCMNIILWDYESVWHDIWPQNELRSLWPIFHGPVILPYILKTTVKTVVAATSIKCHPCLSGHFCTPRTIFNANAPVLSTHLSNASSGRQILSQIVQKSSLSGHFERPDL